MSYTFQRNPKLRPHSYFYIRKQVSSFIFLMLSFIFYLPAAIGNTAPLPKFLIMTEDWAPYNFVKSGVLQGISVDLMVLMLERIGSSQSRNDIKLYPWARGYKLVQTVPNSILFTTTRNDERENMFKWVGPIFNNSLLLHALKKRAIHIDSPQELKKYRIATYFNDVGEEILVHKFGLKLSQLHRSPNQIDGLRRVYRGRDDLFVGSQVTVDSLCQKAGFKTGDFEPVFVVASNEMDYAFNKQTPDSVIQMFQHALDQIKSEGKLDELFHLYKP